MPELIFKGKEFVYSHNLFALIKALQQTERVRLRVNAAKKAA